MAQDNSTVVLKNLLRWKFLKFVDQPVILEAYGGNGEIWKSCYRDYHGCVMERERSKADVLAKQRDHWPVYCCDNVVALKAGLPVNHEVNFADFDAHGDPWPALEAFLDSGKHRPDTLVVVVTDGLHQSIHRRNISTGRMRRLVEEHGEEYLRLRYPEVCRVELETITRSLNYKITEWTGYICNAGGAQRMTHFAAVLS